MKALSLWQPGATLIAVGAKSIETRSWQTAYRGPIAIHAAAKYTAALRHLAVTDPYHQYLLGHFPLPFGAIVAVANLCFVCPTEGVAFAPDMPPHEEQFGDYSPGRFAWLLRDVKPLRVAMPCRGRQGLFNVTGICRVCGCWDLCGCEEGCAWLAPDLCTACIAHATDKELNAFDRKH